MTLRHQAEGESVFWFKFLDDEFLEAMENPWENHYTRRRYAHHWILRQLAPTSIGGLLCSAAFNGTKEYHGPSIESGPKIG